MQRFAVERRDLVVEVGLSGELEAAEGVDLGPPPVSGVWDFTIASLTPEGTVVQAGTPVLRFDTSLLQQELQTAVAERDQAAQTLRQRETDLRAEREKEALQAAEAEARLRRSSLKAEVEASVMARREIELARLDRDLAQAEVRYRQERLGSLERRSDSELGSLRAQLARAADKVDQLEAKIAAMTVRAPRAGPLVYKADRMGSKKKVGDRVWRLDVVAQIPDLDSLRARGEVDEAQSGRIEVGQRVTFRLDAQPDRDHAGRVAAVDRVVRARSFRNPRSVVSVLIALDRTDPEQMRPGMRLQGTIEVERRVSVIAAPLAALGFDGEGAYVVVAGAGGKLRPVLGARDASWVEVLAGLEPGARLEPPGRAGG